MALNRLGVEAFNNRPPAATTMPAINLPDLDTKAIEAEAREAQARVRVIGAGRYAWEQIAKSGSFSGWVAVGKALAVGRDFARTPHNSGGLPGGSLRSLSAQWIEAHGFAGMQKSVRSVAIEFAENIAAIEAWRSTLDERTRRRLVHPLSNVRRWRAAMAFGEAKCPQDLKREAASAWRRFRSSLEALPADEAMPLWQAAQAHAAAFLATTPAAT
jgi:hypothetical protein